MKQKRIYNAVLTWFIPLIMSVIFGVICFESTNPICNNPGADSLCFSLIGRGMSEGMVPYRDFVDNKGLILYFLNALPQVIFPYEYFMSFGIWIFEILFLYITLIFIHKSARLMDIKFPIIIQLLFLTFLYLFIEGGNLCEEYSLCFSMVGTYYVLKYIKEDASSNHLLYSFIVGIMFILCFFTRPNNAFPLFIMILGILIYLIARKKYCEIFKCVVGCIISFCAIVIPIIIYLYINGALEDCIMQSFLANLEYSSVSGGIYNLIGKTYFLLATGMFIITLLSSLIYMIMHKKSMPDLFIGAITIMVGLLSLWSSIMSGYSFLHYLMIPLVALIMGIILLFSVFCEIVDIFSVKMGSRIKPELACYMIVLILFCICCVKLPVRVNNFVQIWKERIVTYKENGGVNDKQKEILEIMKKIPISDRDSICTLAPIGYNYFFLYSNTYPCYRLFVCHDLFKAVIPGLEEEYNTFMQENPPKFLILTQKELTKEIEHDYVLFDAYNNGKVMIMKKK